MKIQNVLNEDGGGAVLAYKQLSPLQLGVLRKIASGNFNFDNASPQAHDAIEGLSALGLVDDISLDITDRGQMALNYATKLGGSVDRRNLDQARSNFKQQGSVAEPESSFELE